MADFTEARLKALAHARDEFIDTNSIPPRLYLMTRMLIEQGKKK